MFSLVPHINLLPTEFAEAGQAEHPSGSFVYNPGETEAQFVDEDEVLCEVEEAIELQVVD